jgi:hypothetical protein
MPTCPFIHTQKSNTRCTRPRSNLAHIVHEPFESRIALLLVVVVELDDHAQVLGQLLQVRDIARDKLGSAVVVFQQADKLGVREAERAAEAEEDAEEQGDEVVSCKVEQRLYRAGFLVELGFLGRRAVARAWDRFGGGRGFGGEEGFEEGFALLDGELLAPESGFFGGCEACGSHCGRCGVCSAVDATVLQVSDVCQAGLVVSTAKERRNARC